MVNLSFVISPRRMGDKQNACHSLFCRNHRLILRKLAFVVLRSQWQSGAMAVIGVPALANWPYSVSMSARPNTTEWLNRASFRISSFSTLTISLTLGELSLIARIALGNETNPANVRVFAATKRDLPRMIA